jgi:hypothetical protein
VEAKVKINKHNTRVNALRGEVLIDGEMVLFMMIYTLDGEIKTLEIAEFGFPDDVRTPLSEEQEIEAKQLISDYFHKVWWEKNKLRLEMRR